MISDFPSGVVLCHGSNLSRIVTSVLEGQFWDSQGQGYLLTELWESQQVKCCKINLLNKLLNTLKWIGTFSYTVYFFIFKGKSPSSAGEYRFFGNFNICKSTLAFNYNFKSYFISVVVYTCCSCLRRPILSFCWCLILSALMMVI